MNKLSAFVLSMMVAGSALAAEWHGTAPEVDTEPMSVASVVASAETLAGSSLLVSGRVTDVCTNRGCWAVFEDNGEMLRIKVRDHAFALPADARGPAIAHGVLEKVEISPDHANHLVEEDGADPGLLEQTYEYRLITDGVRLNP